MTLEWRPSATIETLRQRAQLIADIRQFFAQRAILEVETPQLARYGVTDPHMPLITTENPIGEGPSWVLQSSPEYAMKRLLAAGSGDIYQICKAYRKGEIGKHHNPEFTMLEWYRCNFDDAQLMTEATELLYWLFQIESQRISYQALFEQHLNINPHLASSMEMESIARNVLDVSMQSNDRSDWLNLLMVMYIEPRMNPTIPTFVYDYPADQAALAKLTQCTQTGISLAKRFELYWHGLELANGYWELTDPDELYRRLQKETNKSSINQQQPDPYLLAAQSYGLPDCSGVAFGLDRLFMIYNDEKFIDKAITFSVKNA